MNDDFKHIRGIKLLFVILLIQAIMFEIFNLSVFPVVSSPKFKGDEFKKVFLPKTLIDKDQLNLMKSIYPNDKRYYLFIQREMTDTTKYKLIANFLLEQSCK